jgi:WhiB family redox-sensing transcriptional regulator
VKYEGIFQRLVSSGNRAPDTLAPAVHWAVDAVCRDDEIPPDVWFPDHSDVLAVEYAKGLCRRCPVLVRCRQDALNRGEQYGVWGGLDEGELRAVRRVRAANAKRAAAQEEQVPADTGELAKAS